MKVRVSERENLRTLLRWAVTALDTDLNVAVSNGVVGNSKDFGPFSAGTYSFQAVYGGDANNNGATSDCSSGEVLTVWALTVTKGADTSFTRTYTWDIAKSADTSTVTLNEGQSATVGYTVTVSATYQDSDWAVAGSITVHNPAPISATISSVSDVVSATPSPISATVDCSVTYPYTLSAGSDLSCTYSASLPDAATRTNTATATIQNTPLGTTDFTGTHGVDFISATINRIDASVTVSDTLQGSLPTVSYSDLVNGQKEITYEGTIGPYAKCQDTTVDNTASFVTSDTGATDSADWSITVRVLCALTVNVDPSLLEGTAQFTIGYSGGSCTPAAGSYAFNHVFECYYDTSVTLTAGTPVTGSDGYTYYFDHWDVDAIGQGIGTNPITVTMTEDHTATAYYLTPQTLTATFGGDMSPSGAKKNGPSHPYTASYTISANVPLTNVKVQGGITTKATSVVVTCDSTPVTIWQGQTNVAISCGTASAHLSWDLSKQNNVFTWTFASMSAGESHTLTIAFNFQPTSPGTYSITGAWSAVCTSNIGGVTRTLKTPYTGTLDIVAT
jgi:hypothetical protein